MIDLVSPSLHVPVSCSVETCPSAVTAPHGHTEYAGIYYQDDGQLVGLCMLR